MPTIHGLFSVDAATPDSALDAVRQFNPHCPEHPHIAACAANLTPLSERKVIVGHGSSGVIVTGGGPGISGDRNRWIAPENCPEWWDQMAKVGITELFLYSCHTGASPRGAEFLRMVSTATTSPVHAPTGFLYVSAQTGCVSLQEGATWQVSRPSDAGPPKAIEPPKFQAAPKGSRILLGSAAGPRVVEPPAVERIRVHPNERSLRALVAGEAGAPKSLDGAQPSVFLDAILFEHPFLPPGVPLALEEATFEMRLEDGEVRNFQVFNDRLVIDRTTGWGYPCDPSIGDFF